MKLVRIASLLVCALCPVHAADTSLDAVYQRIDKAARSFKGVTGNIRRVQHMPVIEADTISTGTFVMRKSKAHDFQYLLRLDSEAKDGQPSEREEVELNGTKIQVYRKKNNTVSVGDLGKKNKLALEQFLSLGFGNTSGDLQVSYTIALGGAEAVEGQAATRLVLIPKSDDLRHQYPKIEMWISDTLGIAVQHKLYEQGKDYQLNTYTNLKLRDSIPDSELKLEVPKDARREPFNH